MSGVILEEWPHLLKGRVAQPVDAELYGVVGDLNGVLSPEGALSLFSGALQAL